MNDRATLVYHQNRVGPTAASLDILTGNVITRFFGLSMSLIVVQHRQLRRLKYVIHYILELVSQLN